MRDETAGELPAEAAQAAQAAGPAPLKMRTDPSVEELRWWLAEHVQLKLPVMVELSPEVVRQLIAIMMPVKQGGNSMPMNDAICYAIIHMGTRLAQGRAIDQWLSEETS